VVVIGVVVLTVSSAWAQLPTCAQLDSNPAYGLTGNPSVIAHSVLFVPAGAGTSVAYCRIDFVVSERGGPQFGYAPGEIQTIGLRVGLPANSVDSGSGGGPEGEGAWNGRIRNLGGGGLVGSLSAVTIATNARYVGSFTDSGHTGMDPSFGVIQATHQLDLGKIQDFFSESLRLQYQWALRLANSYYGKPAIRNYWDGCSTGGRQGLVLASKYGNDFDGFLIGAPHTNHSRTSSGASWRSWVNLEVAGGTVTPEKIAAAISRMIGECDAQDGVVDGLLSDPRTCHASAALNICGQPGAPAAPTCLNTLEAQALEMALGGAHNDLGKKVWVGYGRGAMAGMSVAPPGMPGTGGNGIFGWAVKDMTYDYRLHPLSDWDDIHELGTRTVGPYIDMGTPNLDLTKNRGGKILMWHGLADQLIPWEQNVYYYNKVVDNYQGLDNVTPWFKFFLAPGVTHCGGGVGPQPLNLFETMVNWVEKGSVPGSILSSGGGRVRPLCPFPQTAIYDGVGDPNLPASFHCGGNIETKAAKCEELLVQYQHETGPNLEPLGGEDEISCGLAFAPVTTATVSPDPVNGANRGPVTVTLTATDRDSDFDYTEYLLNPAQGWVRYSGPFQITPPGQYTLEYRSVDKAGHVEALHTLQINITVPGSSLVISGMPLVPCVIWPPNKKLVQIADVKASDGASGATSSLSINVTANEALAPGDVVIAGGVVQVRADRNGNGSGRVYTVTALATGVAGNTATATGTCTVPHDQGK